MQEKEVDAFLVTKAENIRYLSGFTGGSDGKLIVTHDGQYLLTDARYWEQAAIESSEWELIRETAPGFDGLAELTSNYRSLAIESHTISYELYQQLNEKISSELIPLSNIIENLRIIKDETELSYLRRAAEISDEVFTVICQNVRTGLSERQIASDIVYLLRQKGCEKESFDVIAVAGENAALPHGLPGDKVLKPGDMLTLDYGGFYQGYAGDMTRTLAISGASERLRDNYYRLREAQELGLAKIKAGEKCCDIDQAVRNSLKKYGLDEYFSHGTGHGVGLEIHENPRLSRNSEAMLAENMVVTVEPGIYIPGWGGIRIEDTVIVKNGGCEVITHSDKGLIIL